DRRRPPPPSRRPPGGESPRRSPQGLRLRPDAAAPAPAPAPSGLGPFEQRAPPLLVPARLPERERAEPGGGEEPHDDVTEPAEVESGEQRPEAAVQLELHGKHLQELDRADEPGDGDREARDADVVVDLA